MPRKPLPIGTWGTISLNKQETGTWRASALFRGYDGKRRQVNATGKTAIEAQHRLLASLQDKASAGSGDLSTSSTLTTACELWLQEIKGQVAASTFDEYQRLVRRRIVPAIGELRLSEVTVGTVDRFLRAEAARTASQVRNTRSALRQVLSLAVRHDTLRSNPVRDAAPIRVKHKAPRSLTIVEVANLRKLVAAHRTGPDVKGPKPDSFMLDLVDVMLGTGARIGEALALRWIDLDLDSGQPILTISGTIVEESGSKPYRKDSTKTKAGHRTLLLGTHTTEVLRRRQTESTSEWVFPSRLGGIRPIQNVHRYWRNVIKGTDFEWVNLHTLRKTVATHVSEAHGAEDAAKQLGHTGPDVTRRHYIEKAAVAPDFTAVLDGLVSAGE